jgi:hypothetical protein
MQADQMKAVFEAIDAANARDPSRDGAEPAALVYGRRMSEVLARLTASPSTPLAIAARGQHIERWTSPRTSFPAGRAGYLRWRNELKDFHARRLAEIMGAQGLGETEIARVGALVRKEHLKRDAEAQTLEDAACLVFLEHHLTAFMAKTDDQKLADILAKTWRKMSGAGHAEALKLGLPSKVTDLLHQGLAQLGGQSG